MGNAYGKAFKDFRAGSQVPLDNAGMREFLLENTAITMEDLDMSLLRADPEGNGLSKELFLKLIRDNTASDSEVLEQFMNSSADGESISSTDCRSCLLLFVNQTLAVELNDVRWEAGIDVIMADIGVTVSMESWVECSKKFCRMIRLARHLKV